MCVVNVLDVEAVQPFSLNECMERLDTGIVPWIRLGGITFKDSTTYGKAKKGTYYLKLHKSATANGAYYIRYAK